MRGDIPLTNEQRQRILASLTPRQIRSAYNARLRRLRKAAAEGDEEAVEELRLIEAMKPKPVIVVLQPGDPGFKPSKG